MYLVYRHNFLLICDKNQKKVEVDANSTGATKQQLLVAAAQTYGIEGNVILQAYNKHFDDYVDIEDNEVLSGPAKIRIIKTPTEEVEVLPVTINVTQDDIQKTSISK